MSRLNLYQTPEHSCPYLEEESAVTQFIDPNKIPDINLYSQLSNYGFRRSGEHLYRPACPSCNQCISIRIPVNDFVLSKSQKRCLKSGEHFDYYHFDAKDTDEHYALYENYINTRHKGGDMYPATRELFQTFLLSSWSNTHFMEIRDQGKLIACAVYDRLTDGISAVYCYFAPSYTRYSPGKLAILYQINYAKENGLSYLYLGYQINKCQKMNYKTSFHPYEQFRKMQWQRVD